MAVSARAHRCAGAAEAREHRAELHHAGVRWHEPHIPPQLLAQWPKEHITLLSTILQAFDELTDASGRVKRDGKSSGKDGVVKSGCAVECLVDELFYRTRWSTPMRAKSG